MSFDEIRETVNFLQDFDSYSEYQTHLNILLNYIEKLEKIKTKTLKVEENDAIVITIDLDIFDIDEGLKILQIVQNEFPNNKVVCTLKGIDIEVKKENECNCTSCHCKEKINE